MVRLKAHGAYRNPGLGLNFNSNMVRLKDAKEAFDKLKEEFQFQHGTIKSIKVCINTIP